jgi:hypothetical protein
MTSDHARLVATASRICTALAAASTEVGGRALRGAASDSADVARTAAWALRAPCTQRAAAGEVAMRAAYDTQRRQVHAMRGLSTLWGMAFLRQLDAAQGRRTPL